MSATIPSLPWLACQCGGALRDHEVPRLVGFDLVSRCRHCETCDGWRRASDGDGGVDSDTRHESLGAERSGLRDGRSIAGAIPARRLSDIPTAAPGAGTPGGAV